MENPYISKIRVYPIKSLDPVTLNQATIGVHSLKYDREFAMVTPDRKYVNGKRTGRVNQLKAIYKLEAGLVGLSDRKSSSVSWFNLRAGNKELDLFLTEFFGMRVRLIRNTTGQHMDIPTASSVTVVSENSLKSILKDINDLDIENLRLRFRANIELAGVPAFWEENLFGSPTTGMQFRLGQVEMIGVSPRERCNVPPRDPFTGEPNRAFARAMIKSRTNSLPEESKMPSFGNLYHLTVNTYLPKTQAGKVIATGDKLEILEPVKLSSFHFNR